MHISRTTCPIGLYFGSLDRFPRVLCDRRYTLGNFSKLSKSTKNHFNKVGLMWCMCSKVINGELSQIFPNVEWPTIGQIDEWVESFNLDKCTQHAYIVQSGNFPIFPKTWNGIISTIIRPIDVWVVSFDLYR